MLTDRLDDTKTTDNQWIFLSFPWGHWDIKSLRAWWTDTLMVGWRRKSVNCIFFSNVINSTNLLSGRGRKTPTGESLKGNERFQTIKKRKKINFWKQPNGAHLLSLSDPCPKYCACISFSGSPSRKITHSWGFQLYLHTWLGLSWILKSVMEGFRCSQLWFTLHKGFSLHITDNQRTREWLRLEKTSKGGVQLWPIPPCHQPRAQSATSSHLYLGKLKALEAAASSREFQPPLSKNE